MGSLLESLNRPPTRKYLAVGTGVGIAIGRAHLRVLIVRVRFDRVAVLAAHTIGNFRERPAAEWGAEYEKLLQSAGLGHVAATVLLPRREVIVRQVEMPGVADRDLASALAFEIESLHPYEDEEAVTGWARLPGTASVLVGVAHRPAIERYAELFTEAGVRVTAFTFSAPALASAIAYSGRSGAFLAAGGFDEQSELYGESGHYPVYSTAIPGSPDRAVAIARAELRLEAGEEPRPFASLLPAAKAAPEGFDPESDALPYATALAAACPWLAITPNLLPPAWRAATSRVRYIPTAALAATLAGLLIALAVQPGLADASYARKLEQEVARLEPEAARAQELERAIEDARHRVLLLDQFSRRIPSDLELVAELSRILEPPAWLNQLEVTRETLSLSGEAPQAAGLLKLLDESPHVRNSEFAMPISGRRGKETFRVRALREGAP